LNLLNDTLERLDPAHQEAFLQEFLKNLAGVNIAAKECMTHWREILNRRRDLMQRLGRPVSLKTAAVDYLSATELLHQPVLLEYDDLKRLRREASTDSLTGLYNRRLFEEHLAREMARSQRHGHPLTLILLDLHNFKRVNDTYGHVIGDEVLNVLARSLTKSTRVSDYACRLGGDEFALLLTQSQAPSAHSTIQRMAGKFENYAQRLAPGAGLGLDYGLASFPEDGDSAVALFEVADHNLYDNKVNNKRVAGTNPAKTLTKERAAESPAHTSPALAVSDPFSTEPQRPQRRRYERLSLETTDAYGVLRHGKHRKHAKVVDMSFGGVCFLLDGTVDLPDTFYARLHIPIFPEADFKLRRVHEKQCTPGSFHIGCSFVS